MLDEAAKKRIADRKARSSRRGRPGTTGHFKSRQDLVHAVVVLFCETEFNVSLIAKMCGVNYTSVYNITRQNQEVRSDAT